MTENINLRNVLANNLELAVVSELVRFRKRNYGRYVTLLSYLERVSDFPASEFMQSSTMDTLICDDGDFTADCLDFFTAVATSLVLSTSFETGQSSDSLVEVMMETVERAILASSPSPVRYLDPSRQEPNMLSYAHAVGRYTGQHAVSSGGMWFVTMVLFSTWNIYSLIQETIKSKETS